MLEMGSHPQDKSSVSSVQNTHLEGSHGVPRLFACAGVAAQLERIVERAGLEKWQLFHAMRSFCESGLVKQHPLYMAARWLGSTPGSLRSII